MELEVKYTESGLLLYVVTYT